MRHVAWEQYQSIWNGTYVSGSPGRIDARSMCSKLPSTKQPARGLPLEVFGTLT